MKWVRVLVGVVAALFVVALFWAAVVAPVLCRLSVECVAQALSFERWR